MFIKSHLFIKGHPMKREPGLSDLLDAHKRTIRDKIKAISDLDTMTDQFLEKLVKDSLVAPLAIQFDRMTKKFRTEQFDGAELPFEQVGDRGRSYPRQIARLSIPFTGDRKLLEYTPIPTPSKEYPRGEVSGSTILFDVVLWGSPDDAQRVPREIQTNRESLVVCATGVNQQVKAFNESLPADVKAVFATKLEELTKQHAIFEAIGIPEEPDPPALPSAFTKPQPKKGKARAVRIIQIIEAMYVQQLTQTNYNAGDVNNAIQGAN